MGSRGGADVAWSTLTIAPPPPTVPPMPEPTRNRAPAAEAPKRPAAPATLARFLEEARAFEPVRPLRADPRVVQHNVGIGVAAVMEWADHVREHLPHVDLGELRSLPDLALCLVHA